MANGTPVIIDTDVALDDWMAISYLLNIPSVNVIGITTTGVGAAHLTAGTRNVQNVLQTLGQPKIPVAAGTNAPLIYSNIYPGAFRTMVDSAYGLDLPQNDQPPQSVSAADFLVDTISGSSTPVTVLSIGGATNLALAFQQSSDLMQNIAGIYMMGGALDVPGDVGGWADYLNTVAEWNIFVDPAAAQSVFQSGVPITLVPLDATDQVPLDMDFYGALEYFITINQNFVPPAAQLVFAGLTTQLSTIQQGQYFFWDPLAAVVLSDASVVNSIQSTPIAVQQTLDEENDTSGQTYATDSGPSVQVIMGVDATAVESIYFSAITGGASLVEWKAQAAKAAATGKSARREGNPSGGPAPTPQAAAGPADPRSGTPWRLRARRRRT